MTMRLLLLASFLGPLCFADRNVDAIKSTVCKTIDLALRNGSEISWKDYSHCHFIVPSEKRPQAVASLSFAAANYHSLICHAHETDGKRKFDSGSDNVNIFVTRGSATPSFTGITKSAALPELRRAGYIPDGLAMAGDLNFFVEADVSCSEFKAKPETITCSGKKYCFGTDLKADVDSILRRASRNGVLQPSAKQVGSPVCSVEPAREGTSYKGCKVTLRGISKVEEKVPESWCTYHYCDEYNKPADLESFEEISD